MNDCGACGKPLDWEELTPTLKTATCCLRRYSYEEVETEHHTVQIVPSLGKWHRSLRNKIDVDYAGELG